MYKENLFVISGLFIDVVHKTFYAVYRTSLIQFRWGNSMIASKKVYHKNHHGRPQKFFARQGAKKLGDFWGSFQGAKKLGDFLGGFQGAKDPQKHLSAPQTR